MTTFISTNPIPGHGCTSPRGGEEEKREEGFQDRAKYTCTTSKQRIQRRRSRFQCLARSSAFLLLRLTVPEYAIRISTEPMNIEGTGILDVQRYCFYALVAGGFYRFTRAMICAPRTNLTPKEM